MVDVLVAAVQTAIGAEEVPKRVQGNEDRPLFINSHLSLQVEKAELKGNLVEWRIAKSCANGHCEVKRKEDRIRQFLYL